VESRELSVEKRSTLGDSAEEVASRHLQRAGLVVIGRNVVVESHEIDIVALDGSCLCFVEVRSRRSMGQVNPLETLTSSKIRRLRRAAELYLAYHGDSFAWDACRFDVIGVTFEPELNLHWCKEAFETC
jgi:putative endonuclease